MCTANPMVLLTCLHCADTCQKWWRGFSFAQCEHIACVTSNVVFLVYFCENPVILMSVCPSVCPFTSPACSGGRHLWQPGENPRQRNQFLPLHEPSWQASGKGKALVTHLSFVTPCCSVPWRVSLLVVSLWFIYSPRRPVIEAQTAFSWRRFWRTTTQLWCQHATQTGTWASLKEAALAVAPTRCPTSRMYTSWSASHLVSSPTSPHPSASPPSVSGERGCVLLGPASIG